MLEFKGTLQPFLDAPLDWNEVSQLSVRIFKEGHLDEIDDLLVKLLPLLHIVYYKNIRWLDDRNYAKEDLLQDAILEIYKDMKIRWDKYIVVDNYVKYFETIAKNTMVSLVHAHHSYYKNVEFSPDLRYDTFVSKDTCEEAELNILKEEISANILQTTKRLARCRKKQSQILLKIIQAIYESTGDLISLQSKLRILGIRKEQFEFLYNHVLYLHRFSYNYHKSILRGKQTMVIRLEEIITRFESPTYSVLVNNYGESIIPELFAEFGEETTKKFIKLFEGKTIEVPSYQDFCDDILGGIIYETAEGDRARLYQIASDNNISYRTVSRIFNRYEKQKERES